MGHKHEQGDGIPADLLTKYEEEEDEFEQENISDETKERCQYWDIVNWFSYGYFYPDFDGTYKDIQQFFKFNSEEDIEKYVEAINASVSPHFNYKLGLDLIAYKKAY